MAKEAKKQFPRFQFLQGESLKERGKKLNPPPFKVLPAAPGRLQGRPPYFLKKKTGGDEGEPAQRAGSVDQVRSIRRGEFLHHPSLCRAPEFRWELRGKYADYFATFFKTPHPTFTSAQTSVGRSGRKDPWALLDGVVAGTKPGLVRAGGWVVARWFELRRVQGDGFVRGVDQGGTFPETCRRSKGRRNKRGVGNPWRTNAKVQISGRRNLKLRGLA